jgi:hypothetical protein
MELDELTEAEFLDYFWKNYSYWIPECSVWYDESGRGYYDNTDIIEDRIIDARRDIMSQGGFEGVDIEEFFRASIERVFCDDVDRDDVDDIDPEDDFN